jgi:hypothetical protein
MWPRRQCLTCSKFLGSRLCAQAYEKSIYIIVASFCFERLEVAKQCRMEGRGSFHHDSFTMTETL